MPRILIVDSNPDELNVPIRAECGVGLGDGYAAVLKALRSDVDAVVIAPYDGDTTPPLDTFDGVVFTGSSVFWSTEDPRVQPLASLMRDVFAAGLPTIGSCNGMQLAATVLGGNCGASPNGREDGLARNVRLTPEGHTHPMMAGRQDEYAVPCVHRDEVLRLPEGAVLLAGNAHSPVQAFVYEQGGVDFWGMQYHPEFTPDFVAGYLQSSGRLTEAEADSLSRADKDAEAAALAGARMSDLQERGRTRELQNWLQRLP